MTHFFGKLALTPASQVPHYRPTQSEGGFENETKNHLAKNSEKM